MKTQAELSRFGRQTWKPSDFIFPTRRRLFADAVLKPIVSLGRVMATYLSIVKLNNGFGTGYKKHFILIYMFAYLFSLFVTKTEF